MNLNDFKTLEKFSSELNNFKIEINTLIDSLISKNSIIGGFGSSRSATTLIKFFDIGDKIKYIVDDNKDKHNKFTPGSRIEVLPSEDIYKKNPNYLIIFAWEHTDKIIAKHKEFFKRGGSFIRIFPNVEIINN